MMRNVTCCILRLSTWSFDAFMDQFIYQISDAGDNNNNDIMMIIVNATNQLFVRVLEVADPADHVHQVAGLALLHKPDKKLASGRVSLHTIPRDGCHILLKSSIKIKIT